jgi:hypothetical protein
MPAPAAIVATNIGPIDDPARSQANTSAPNAAFRSTLALEADSLSPQTQILAQDAGSYREAVRYHEGCQLLGSW